MRTDLNIKNATRIIITRDRSWRVDSRLYNIEIRWDYDGIFAKYCWNNEKYQLPQPIVTKVAYVDPKILAVACSRNGLMYKTRFEEDITNGVYLQIWRKDLRDNLEEQRKIALLCSLGSNYKHKVTPKVEVPKETVSEQEVTNDVELEHLIDTVDKDPVVVHNENISVSKVSYETDDKTLNNKDNSFVADDSDVFDNDEEDDEDLFGGSSSDTMYDFLG